MTIKKNTKQTKAHNIFKSLYNQSIIVTTFTDHSVMLINISVLETY